MLSGPLVPILDVVLTCIWMNGALFTDLNGDFFETLSLNLFFLTFVTGGFLLAWYRLPRIYWIIPSLAFIAAMEEIAWIIMVFGRPLVILGGEHWNLHDFFGTAYLLLKDAELGWRSAVVGGVLFGGGVFFFHKLKSFFVNRPPLLLVRLAVGFLVPTKALPPPSSIWASCTKTATGSCRITHKRSVVSRPQMGVCLVKGPARPGQGWAFKAGGRLFVGETAGSDSSVLLLAAFLQPVQHGTSVVPD